MEEGPIAVGGVQTSKSYVNGGENKNLTSSTLAY